MSALLAARLLELWEAGSGLHPLDRAVLLAAEALPNHAPDEIAGLAIGARDAAILRLRSRAYGDRLDAVARCPACSTEMEFSFSIEALLASHTPVEPAAHLCAPFRAPTSRDLANVLKDMDRDGHSSGDPRGTLVALCRTSIPPTTDSAVDAYLAFSEFVARTDPMADIRIGVDCAACRHAWDETIDPPALLWSEIERGAWHLLQDVSRLARAFGWNEQDVLALTPARRRAYLELL